MMTMMLRVVLILVSVGTMTQIIRKIRKAKLQIEDGIFWVLVSAMFVVFSLFPPVADFLAHMLGIYATVNFLFLFMIFLLLMRVFSMTIRISQLETKVKELVQKLAIYQLDMEEQRKENAALGIGESRGSTGQEKDMPAAGPKGKKNGPAFGGRNENE